MKNLKKTFVLATSLMLTFTMSAQKLNKKGIKGNGNITTKTVQTEDYDKVKVVGSMDVTLVKGTEGTIEVTTDDNLHEYLDINSNNGVLVISTKKKSWIRTKKGIKITVPYRDIEKVALVGSGDINNNDIIKANSFETSLTGSGDMSLKIEATNVQAKLTGSGDMILMGTTDDFTVKISGSGDLDGRGLKANQTEVSVSGSGDADVYAKKSIKARVNGSGEISYSGNPEKVYSKTSGSGEISSN